jgi:hypothetical protein
LRVRSYLLLATVKVGRLAPPYTLLPFHGASNPRRIVLAPLSARALDHADHRLPAGMHIDVFDRDFLLALLAAVAIKRTE